MSGSSRILLVDGNGFEREAVRGFLEAVGPFAISEAEGPNDAVSTVRLGRVDLAIVNVPYALEEGLAIVRELRIAKPQLPILVLTMHHETTFLRDAMEAGATHCIASDEIDRLLAAAVDLLPHPQVET
jgi:DNA-binding NarL/FixJ family response regulator